MVADCNGGWVVLTAALTAYSVSGLVASEVAPKRRVLHIGDSVDTEIVIGTIVELHGVKAEIETADGRRVRVPYTGLLESVVGITRADESASE